MGIFGEILEEEILLDEFGNRRRRNGYGNDIVSDIFQADAIVDLAEGNIGGFVEDEFLADIF